ncbi:HDIG domain-containing protein [Treponema zuelzerae]|uniref:HDIG domain-containing protein n=1 Tax=Teretinema zuelzerae TaxID=156 RepID=A0AAE3EJ33_9SPIR|nr:HDIG domain-containing metalloprotein [Teretinema zuelzerae]MCD1654708.1 HDIG domain-containing protein [Teretinema zuelzerae]
MNKKKNSLFAHLISLAVQTIRAKLALLILFSSVFAILAFATYFSFLEMNGFRQVNLLDFEVGKVAERDVTTSREISFVDENATRIRREARQKLITAVFRYDNALSASMQNNFSSFALFLTQSFNEYRQFDQFMLNLQQEYPGILEQKEAKKLFSAQNRDDVLLTARSLFKQLVNEGVTAFPDAGMERFNELEVEVVRSRNDRVERQEVPIKTLLTRDGLRSYVVKSLSLMQKKTELADLIMPLFLPFVSENLVYQADESEAKLEAAIRQVQPVLVVLQKGQKIIKRGFIITDESFRQLHALANSGVYIDIRQFSGSLLFLLLTIFLSFYMFFTALPQELAEFRTIVLLCVFFSLNYLIVLIAGRIHFFSLPLDMVMIIPSAMIAMLVTILINQRVAVLFSVILACGSLIASNFTLAPALFSLFSGISGIAVMRVSGKRIDLVKSACILAVLNPLLVVFLSVVFPSSSRDAWTPVFGSSINGFMSGIFVLGFLPIIESLLNTSSSFRLMEFSDLNSPIMKKMLLSVSGTYNHSIMVATLAESACREIGADPLIARVGAYYHDIGKMDQSEYFVENQTDYNKHLDINPRLSATVIRSHVKQGIEKARQLRLPREIIDIISEHHGNSLITYFYNEAKKLDDSVDPEDFTYPGNPPKTKESAVVMLADVVEAACRTLDKPSVPRLEKFIGELISQKINAHQLDSSELTFRDIGIITRTFVNILAGYYHSRIEYPNQKDPDAQEQKIKDLIGKGKRNE